MTSQLTTVKTWNDVALIEERIYLLVPYFTIETTYLVTSGRIPGGMYFDSLDAATSQFKSEIAKSGGAENAWRGSQEEKPKSIASRLL